MKNYTILTLLIIISSGCNFTTQQKKSLINNIPYRTLYEDKGLYPEGEPHIIHCPDFIRFLNNGNYYSLNDCGYIGERDPRIDTIAEKGKYKYKKDIMRLSFFDRKIIKKNASDFVFATDADTIHLEIVSISKDTLIFKLNKLDTLSYFFAKAKIW